MSYPAILLASALAAFQVTPPPSESDSPSSSPPETSDPQSAAAIPPAELQDGAPLLRCIVHYDGRHRICGHVMEELQNAIRIQDESGVDHIIEIERIVAIEPMLEVPVPTEGIVELLDGRQFRGLVQRDDCDVIELMLHGVPIEIDRTRVSKAWILEPVAIRYKQLKPMMPLERPGSHMALCRWLVSEKAWDLAILELESHTKMHRSLEANRLLRVAKVHQKLAEAIRANPREQSKLQASAPGLTPVDEAAVNLVRVYEIDLNDPPRIRITEDTRRRFLEAYTTSALLPSTDAERQQVLDAPPIDFLKLLFAHRAREYYGEVEVLSEPTALRRFRQAVHDQWLIPRCGNSACHGGTNGGRFRLIRHNRLNDQIRTSNLLILDELILDGQPMINWDRPKDSILIQHALPRDRADRPHPPIAGWRPALEAPESQGTLASIQWIESMMSAPRPDYPVESPLPTPKEPDSGPRIPR